MAIHPVARAFDRAADVYERSRPSFSEETIALLVAELAIAPGATVVDLGAGTGKLTRLLVATGARVLALEPVEGMRRQLAAAVAGTPVLAGVAEAMPLRDESVDACTAAQAFHWFRADEALAEIHRVLRAGGALGLVWNHRDERVEWVRRLSEIVDAYEGAAPRQKWEAWRPAFERTDLFTPLEHRTLSYAQRHDVAGLVDRVASISYIAELPAPEYDAVLDEVRALAHDLPQPIELPYLTHVFWCRKRS